MFSSRGAFIICFRPHPSVKGTLITNKRKGCLFLLLAIGLHVDALVSRLFSSKYKEKYAHHIHPAGMAFAAQRVTRGRGGGGSQKRRQRKITIIIMAFFLNDNGDVS